MKEVDDTPVGENESEWDFDAMFDAISIRMRQLERRIANLEAQRPPQTTNPDPEWY